MATYVIDSIFVAWLVAETIWRINEVPLYKIININNNVKCNMCG